MRLERVIMVVGLIAALAGGAAVLWRLSAASKSLFEAMALQGTSLQAMMVADLRKLYSAEVVDRVRTHGVRAVHDFQRHDGAIPLPATLTMALGERLRRARPGADIRLFSDYPFPWRKEDGGPQDDFERQALSALRADPSRPFYRFEESGGFWALRYAVADRMSESCVSCHNSHPASPKRDWRVGDVRGVLAIRRPLDDGGPMPVASMRSGLFRQIWMSVGIAALGMSGVACVVVMLLRRSTDLAEREALARVMNEVALAFGRSGNLHEALDSCTKAMVDHLGAAFARIWILNEREQVLELRASAGMYTHLDGGHARVPVGAFKIGWIAEQKKPHLTNAVIGDPRVGDQQWARRERMVAFAGYPLVVEGRLLGVMAMFARRRLPQALMDAMGTVADCVAVGIRRIQAQEELRVQGTALEAAANAIVITDLQGQIIWANHATSEMTGYRDDELRGANVRLFKSGRHDAVFYRRLWDEVRQGRLWMGEMTNRRKDGTLYEEEMTITPVRDPSGDITHFIAIKQDISERKAAERALATHVRQQEAVAALGHFALDSHDPQVVMDRAVRTVADTLGVELCKVLKLLPDGERLLLCAGVGWRPGLVGSAAVGTNLQSQAGYTLQSSRPVVVEDLRGETRFNGPPLLHEHGVVSGMSVVISGPDGRPFGVLGAHSTKQRAFTKDDVLFLESVAHLLAASIQRNRADQLARESTGLRESVKSLEQVLGVVGHELRTPLAGIRAMSEFLLMDEVRQTEDFNRFLKAINEEVQRMSGSVADLLEVARLNSGCARWNWGQVDISAVMNEALDTVRPLVDPLRVQLRCEPQPCEAKMNGDAGAIRRLLVNLLSNACKHTEQGVISLAARLVEKDGQHCVVFLVRDTGRGMPPEIARRLGVAFALNSGVVGEQHVKGSGLGLAICRGIVAAHGGRISVETEEGRGTAISVIVRGDLPEALPVDRAADIVCEVRS